MRETNETGSSAIKEPGEGINMTELDELMTEQEAKLRTEPEAAQKTEQEAEQEAEQKEKLTEEQEAKLIEEQEAEKKRNARYKKIGVICAVVLGIVVLVLCIYRIFFVKTEVKTTPLSTVTVDHPETGTLEVETALVGTRMPGDVYYALPMTSAKITKVYVKVGDQVKKGDKICELDNSKQIDAAKLNLDAAAIEVKTVEDSIALAKTNLDRMEALYQSGDISAQSYEQVKNSYDQAMAGLEGARLKYDGAKLSYDTQVEFATVTAPAGGIVEQTNMSEDTYCSPSNPVAIISGTGSGKITFNITDRLLKSIAAGDAVRIEKQGSVWDGTVTSVSTMPGQTTGLYAVEAEFDDGGAIPSGASAKVYFVSERAWDALLIPTGSIYHDGGRTYVYTASEDPSNTTGVMEGNTPAIVHKIEVELGLSDTDQTEIKEGLSLNDALIVTWTAQLYEGAHVQVLGGFGQ